MERIVEPELMDDPEQALAYHGADFSEAHGRRVTLFAQAFPGFDEEGPALDIGCGSGDVLFRFARAYPGLNFLGVDGSAAMLALAREARNADPALRERVTLLKGILPDAWIPAAPYQLVMSHSFLHHLHRPGVLWGTIATLAPTGAAVFVADLRRPDSPEEARRIVDRLEAGEPEILRRDFLASLQAAFTSDEVRAQLREADLAHLQVEEVGEIHLIVHGRA